MTVHRWKMRLYMYYIAAQNVVQCTGTHLFDGTLSRKHNCIVASQYVFYVVSFNAYVIPECHEVCCSGFLSHSTSWFAITQNVIISGEPVHISAHISIIQLIVTWDMW